MELECSGEVPSPDDAPRLKEPVEILEHLRAENILRLAAARRIEEARDFVFPETTIIMRDIWKYTLEIEKRTAEPEPTPEPPVKVEPPAPKSSKTKDSPKRSKRSMKEILEGFR